MAILLSCFTVDVDDKTLREIAAAYDHCKKEAELRMLGDPDPQSKRESDLQTNLRVLKDYIVQMMEERHNSPSDTDLPCMDALLHSGFPKDQVIKFLNLQNPGPFPCSGWGGSLHGSLSVATMYQHINHNPLFFVYMGYRIIAWKLIS